MQKSVSLLAAIGFAAAFVSVAFAQSPTPAPVPKCAASMGPLVWYVPSSQMYYRYSTSSLHPGGVAMCEATAKAKGGKAMTTVKQAAPNATGSMMPGAMGSMSPRPATSMGPASKNQGGTMPGAGGQVPNNPASTPNGSPMPQPT